MVYFVFRIYSSLWDLWDIILFFCCLVSWKIWKRLHGKHNPFSGTYLVYSETSVISFFKLIVSSPYEEF